jgi:hypothetical protein
MITLEMHGLYIVCDKCGRTIRFTDYGWMTDKAIEWYKSKKSYCGRCIQERIHRNDPSFDYDKEFSYQIIQRSQEYLDALELLSMCII